MFPLYSTSFGGWFTVGFRADAFSLEVSMTPALEDGGSNPVTGETMLICSPSHPPEGV